MSQTLCIVALSVCAQVSGPERLPYVIALKNGDIIYAFNESSDSLSEQLERRRRIDVELAAPWLAPADRRRTIYLRNLTDPPDIARADSILYERYLREGWEEHGGVQVVTATGETQWVHAREHDLHKRAVALHAEAFPPRANITARLLEPEAKNEPSLLRQWGLHALIVGAGVLLAVLTTWFFYMRRPWGAIKT